MNKTLAEYTKRRGSAKRIAIQTGLTITTIYQVRSGNKPPGIDTALLIEIATNGEVKAETMVRPEKLPLIAWLRENYLIPTI